MFYSAYALYFVDIILGASVQNGKFRSVYLYQAVIDTQCIEGCHTMLHCAHLYSVFGDYSSTGSFGYVVCNGIEGRLSFQVDTLDFVSMVIRSRIESNG